jgi:hypothetical protein
VLQLQRFCLFFFYTTNVRLNKCCHNRMSM